MRVSQRRESCKLKKRNKKCDTREREDLCTYKMCRLLAIVLAGLFQTSYGEEMKESNVTCSDYGEWKGVNVSAIQGLWKASELIMHLEEVGVLKYLTCPVINITEVPVAEPPRQLFGPSTEPSRYHHRAVFEAMHNRQWRQLRLLWDEAGNDVEYSLFFKNDSVGFWTSRGDQTGTLPGHRNYMQFSGSVQVLKAVGEHLLLHFCQAPTSGVNGRPPQLFSVLLSREPRRLPEWQLSAAHDLLRRRGLSVASRRMVCGNSAHKVYSRSATLVLAVYFAILGLKTI